MRQRLAQVIFFLSLFLSGMAQAQTFPPLSGRVVDQANLLTPEAILNLEAKLKAYETKTTDQIVVVSVKSLEGFEISDYANRLLRQWKLGQKDKNNGVLLLIAPTERKVRIEVGYGLEGQLPDAVARLIIQNDIVPRFKANDPSGGVTRATDDIIASLSGDVGEMERRAKRGVTTTQDELTFDQILPFLILGFIIFVFIMNARGANGRRMGNGMGSNNGGWIIIPSGGGFGGGGWGGGGGFSGGGFGGGGGSGGGGGASGSW